MRYSYQEPNRCRYFEEGHCIRDALMFAPCPSYLRYNEDNTNNLPCDFVGYELKTDNKISEIKVRNEKEEKWLEEAIKIERPLGIPSSWDEE